MFKQFYRCLNLIFVSEHSIMMKFESIGHFLGQNRVLKIENVGRLFHFPPFGDLNSANCEILFCRF